MLALLTSCQEQPASESIQTPAPIAESTFYPNLMERVEGLMEGAEAIPEGRKVELRALAQWVSAQLAQSDSAELVFICTHNSRRSHLAQVWAQVGAELHGLDGVRVLVVVVAGRGQVRLAHALRLGADVDEVAGRVIPRVDAQRRARVGGEIRHEIGDGPRQRLDLLAQVGLGS